MPLTPAQQQIADDLLSHNLDLFRLDAAMRNDALRLLKEMQKELTDKLNSGTLTEYSKAATDYLLASIDGIVKNYFDRVQNQINEALQAIPALQNEVVRDAIASVGMGAALAPPTHFAMAMTDVLIQGAPSAEWWDSQAKQTTFKFSNIVRQGIVQGKTNQEIISEVMGKRGYPGIMTATEANAAALVQTSVQTVANAARLESFKRNADLVKGFHQLSTLDSHTTTICMAYSGGEWDLEGKPINGTKLPFNGGPPRHWNCRSVLVPITKTFKELGIDSPEPKPATRASMDGQVPVNTTFDAFLKRKGQAFQDDMLGKGRAELWRQGKITLAQLLDQRGNPLSLEQLQSKYAK